eukprot:m51a1_g1717 hypothetical protein (323) ;mRNA; r:49175-50271
MRGLSCGAAAAGALGLALGLLAAGARASVYWGGYDPSAFGDFVAAAGKEPSVRALRMHASEALPVAAMGAARGAGMVPYVELLPVDADYHWDNWTLRSIADGAHDAAWRKIAAAARFWKYPFFLSFAPWMNEDGAFPWASDRGLFVAAWHRVWGIFNASGAGNANWVWSPSALEEPMAAELYPGDAYVDWVGAEAVNRPHSWRTFTQRLGPLYDELLKVAPFKPVLAVTACAEHLSLVESKQAWIRNTLHNEVTALRRIKGLVWRNVVQAKDDLRIQSSRSAQAAFAACVGSDYYASNWFSRLCDDKIQPLTPLEPDDDGAL